MRNNKLVSEAAKIDAEVIIVSSAAGATSVPMDMQNYRQGLVVCAAKAAAGGAFGVLTLDLMESTASSAAGSSALGSKSAITIGSSVNTAVSTARGVKSLLLTMGSASTTNDKITLKVGGKDRVFQYTTSTANHAATAWTSTLSYFGSTVGSTVNTGNALSMGLLGSAIRSTLNFGPNVEVSTPSTNTLMLTIPGDENANIGFASTYSTAFMIAEANQAVGAFNFDAAELSTGGNRYVKIKASSASTTLNIGITGVRMGGRGMPPSTGFSGNLSTVNFAT